MKRKITLLAFFMFFFSFIIGISFKMSLKKIFEVFLTGAVDLATLKVVAVVILVEIMSNVLSYSGKLKKITSSFELFARNRYLSLIFPSLLMGLLPVPAGAMLSAPLVQEAGNKMNLSAETKTFLNYWFRHIFEFIWPIYPGIILAAAILGISVYKFIAAQLPLFLASVVAGVLFGLRKLSLEKYTSCAQEDNPRSIRRFFALLMNIWPVLGIVFLVLIFKLDIVLSLFLIVIFAIFTNKKMTKKFSPVLKRSFEWRIIFLIFSVLIFKKMLEMSGILPFIPGIFKWLRIPEIFTLFFIPFLIGTISGLSMATVGIAFPVLLPLIGENSPNLTYAMLAFAGGVSGYLLSPFHLCLVVSTAYFKASFRKVWEMVILPVLFVDSVAFIVFYLSQFKW